MVLNVVRRFERNGKILCINPKTKERWEEPIGGPSKLRQVANLVTAVAKQVKAGNPLVNSEVLKKRYDTCVNCPSNKFYYLEQSKIPKSLKGVEGVGKCKDLKCGCYMHLDEKASPSKLLFGTSGCPDKHWLPIIAPKKKKKGCCG